MGDRILEMLKKGGDIWDRMREKKPLVYHITNFVAMPEQAHITIAIGASPVMALSPDEARDMCAISNALLINIGTPSQEQFDAMKQALMTANEKDIPVLLDPVGYGATPFRNYVVDELLKIGRFTVIKGNSGEIMALAGNSGTVRGVDAVTEENKGLIETVKSISKRYGSIVIATGEEDFVSNGVEVFSISGGSKVLRKITGSGCMAGSIVASLLGLKEDPLISSITGIIALKAAAKRADERSSGPGSFRMHLFDELAILKGEDIIKEGDIVVWT
jgi:hydroxyethylthiazole kinase